MADLPTVPASCRGERCQFCDGQATRKIAEEILEDTPGVFPVYMPGQNVPADYLLGDRHPYTCYVCEEHFWMVMRQPSAQSVNAVLEAATKWLNASMFNESYLIGILWNAVKEFRKERAKQSD